MNIQVAGVGLTKFGELWDKNLFDLALDAASEALQDAGLDGRAIDAIYVGNMLSGTLTGQEHIGAVVASLIGSNAPAMKLEGACASGGLAMHAGVSSLLSGQYETVLVVGVEKMTDAPPNKVMAGLMGAGAEEERLAGLTFPGLYALMAKAHMAKYGTTKEHMAHVAVKNHYHASLNEKAQFPFEISIEKVMKSSRITDPFTLFDASPITDGAAAVILTVESRIKNQELRKKNVFISASTVATDTISLSQRESLTELKGTKIAGEKAFAKAGVSPKDIDVVEVHDCFTIAEILAMEDLGFCAKGEAGEMVKNGHTRLGGMLPMNTSGGLKACGHPVGATGVKQIVEITQQLQGRGGRKQVEGAKVGLTQNVGGTGATVVIHILQI
ncbi:MAG: thiolase domain-containing protein [Candidatus Levybacteria bacterium]|nr:thiolase domain-containing protein [Candidatus Levybacteria bacterium]